MKLTYIVLAFCAVALSACEEQDVRSQSIVGASSITYFPEILVGGESIVLSSCGSAFQDPGVSANVNGADISVASSVSGLFGGSIEAGDPDKYTLSYSAANDDGFQASSSRQVWMSCTGDLTTSLEGLYTATVFRNGTTGPAYTDMAYVIVRKVGENTYELSDAIGGYYSMGRGYGDAYLGQGIRIVAEDISTNNFSFEGAGTVGSFGGGLEMKSMEVDAAAKTINFTSEWSFGYTFEVTLNQVSI